MRGDVRRDRAPAGGVGLREVDPDRAVELEVDHPRAQHAAFEHDVRVAGGRRRDSVDPPVAVERRGAGAGRSGRRRAAACR